MVNVMGRTSVAIAPADLYVRHLFSQVCLDDVKMMWWLWCADADAVDNDADDVGNRGGITTAAEDDDDNNDDCNDGADDHGDTDDNEWKKTTDDNDEADDACDNDDGGTDNDPW